MFKTVTAVLLVAAGVAVDQHSKYFFLTHPDFVQDVFSFFSFRYVENYGIAFGIPVPQSILLGMIGVVLVLVLGWLVQGIRKKNHHIVLASLLIIGGAISNLYDRITHGYVVDYIDISWFTVFNFADVMIFFGVCILLLNEIKAQKSKKLLG